MENDDKKVLEIQHFFRSRTDLSGYDLSEVERQVQAKFHRAVIKAKLGDRAVTVRYAITINPADTINFSNEVTILKSLESAGLSAQPIVIDFDLQKLWVIQTYVPGEKAGTSLQFSSDFIQSIRPKNLISHLVNFKKIKPRLADRPTNVFDLYDKHYDHLMKNWPNQDFSALKEWNDYFKVSLKIFLKDNLYLAHADMNPGNIIYENNAINGLIDWELARYDGYWRDFANIYVASILFPAWQSEFLKELAIPENEIFQFNFYVIFYLALNISNFDFALKNKKNEIYRSGHLTHDEINHLLDVNLTALQKINLK